RDGSSYQARGSGATGAPRLVRERCEAPGDSGEPGPQENLYVPMWRQNLTIRMQLRRLTRLTSAFSKKWENLWAAYCLHFAYYYFCRIHQTLRVTPAVERGNRQARLGTGRTVGSSFALIGSRQKIGIGYETLSHDRHPKA